MFDLVIRNGLVVSPEGVMAADIGIEDGVIRAVAPPGEALPGGETVEAAGRFVLPGLVDAHMHVHDYGRDPAREDFASATRAAALGGVTTILVMPTDEPSIGDADTFALKRQIGERLAAVDFALQALVGPQTADLRALADCGAVSYEIFLASRALPDFVINHDDPALVRCLRLIREVAGIAGITPHSSSMIAETTAWNKMNSPPKVPAFAATRPPVSEALGIARAAAAAAPFQTEIHVRSLSCALSIDLMRRLRGLVPLSSEVMCHHLLYLDEEAERFGPYGVIIPPMRSLADRTALRDAVRSGDITMVVSDHSPHLRSLKEAAWNDIWLAPPGMTGLQTMWAAMLKLVEDGALNLSQWVAACAEAPARRFGLYPRKGAIRVGADADLILLDPLRRTTLRHEDQVSKADYTTMAGMQVPGAIEAVYLRGGVIARDGVLSEGPTRGRFVRP